MRIRDMFDHFCGMCWGAFFLCSLPFLGGLLVLVLAAISGVPVLLFLQLAAFVFGYELFVLFVGYMEARDHYKRGA
jgi:cytochrome c biogenesis protein CcdA